MKRTVTFVTCDHPAGCQASTTIPASIPGSRYARQLLQARSWQSLPVQDLCPAHAQPAPSRNLFGSLGAAFDARITLDGDLRE